MAVGFHPITLLTSPIPLFLPFPHSSRLHMFSPSSFPLSFPPGTRELISPNPSYTVALNYYPIVRAAFIRDSDGDRYDAHRYTSTSSSSSKGTRGKRGNQLTVLTAQTGGATSRSVGQLEVMLHRRSLQDDSKGACQVFNDTTGQYVLQRFYRETWSSCIHSERGLYPFTTILFIHLHRTTHSTTHTHISPHVLPFIHAGMPPSPWTLQWGPTAVDGRLWEHVALMDAPPTVYP